MNSEGALSLGVVSGGHGPYSATHSSPAQPTVKHTDDHIVQFYDDDRFLIEAVAKFVRDGFDLGEPAVVIATPEHRAALEAELAKIGLDVPALVGSKRYFALDARETLLKFMAGRSPNRELFHKFVGGIVAEIGKGSTGVRAFGEMVALLWADGNAEAAVQLEELWNGLVGKHQVNLFCAYPMDSFADSGKADQFIRICREHTRVLPTESYSLLKTEDEKLRLVAELQQKASMLEAEVSLRRRAERELQRRRRELTAFVETASISLHWVSADGTVLWANNAEMELLGYSPDEYIGHSITEFHADQFVIKDILERLKNGDQLRDYEARMKCKDGSIRMVAIDSSAFWDGDTFVHSQCFTRDITGQRRAEEVGQHLAAMVESCDDAVISKDLNGVITSWNSGAQRVFGYTSDEAVGKPVTILIPPDRLDEEPDVLSRIRAGKRVDHYETIRRRKDGTLIEISLTVSPVRNRHGEIIGASKVARDITLQKKHQRELKNLAEQLEGRVEERTASLKAAIAQMEEFSYTVSHDLRAPLRAMSLYANVILEECGQSLTAEPHAIEYLHRISDNCARLDRMILDVLVFGRVARDGIEISDVSLDELVIDIVQHLPALQLPQADIETAKLGKVRGHEPSLSQALSNLLANAVKFVEPGTVPRVRLWTERRGNALRLWVEDNGIGIDPKYQHKLFTMFERIHPDLPYEGTGVGLAIVKKAVGRMSGSVGVESDGKTGSRFWIELPIAESAKND